MALLIDGGRIPPRWADTMDARSSNSAGRSSLGAESVNIALINNMPDPAMEDTEMQFMELLDVASGVLPVYLKLYSLPRVPRGDRGLQRLSSFYDSVDNLWHSRIDAVIMTGTEPHESDLRREPYWQALTDVLDWADRNTFSTVLSCLAAHAGVLHSDGIPRQPLADKQFGVFESSSVADHELTRHAARPMRFPHSRWNGLREDALCASGYSVLTKSNGAGVDLFVKEKQKSLFVYFQGHPEYGKGTLLKEYRRDIKRFLRHERDTYPTMPAGYFDPATVKLLSEFQAEASAHRAEEQLVSFPQAAVAASLQNTWQSSATCLYHNWLQLVSARKHEAKRHEPKKPEGSAFAAMAQVGASRRPLQTAK